MKKFKLLIFILLALFVFTGCLKKEAEKPAEVPVSADDLKPGLVVGGERKDTDATKEVRKEEVKEEEVGLANPASVLCEDLGYRLEIRESEEGTSGYCSFPDMSECEEWAFFRGECGADQRKLTLDEVKKHASEDDCWQAIEGKIYKLTSYIASHPGGKSMLRGCGTDATELYNTKPGSGRDHSEKADQDLVNYYLADLVE